MSCESSITDLTMGMMEDDCREQLLSHIKELHEAVVEMKGAFTAAQLQLQTVSSEVENPDNVTLKTELEDTRAQCEQRGGDILQLVLALKGEVVCIKEALQSTQFFQHGLQSSLHSMMSERDLLLDELAKSGAISDNLRVRLHSRLNLNDEGCPRPSSGSHSHQSSNGSNDNDSGVALLLEKAHAAFQPTTLLQQSSSSSSHLHLLQGNGGSGGSGVGVDLAALANHSANANVQEYLNGLGMEARTGRIVSNGEIVSEDLNAFNNGMVYDSDCSLTLAATKSLSLSNSLSKQCGLELDQDQQNVQLQQEKESCSLLKGVQGNNASSVSDPIEGQRLKVAKELLETERKYCHTLRTIQETFAYPLKNSGVLSLKDINTLFPEEVFSLHEKHCSLLSQLEERIVSWKSQPKIGDILERFTNGNGSDVLRLYTNYVNDFPEVLKTFHKLCRSSREFTHFLKSSLEHPTCRGLDLGAFLLSPVQRMPRYILLLKQILKYTDPSHPDYKDITTCLDRLRDYLKRLNDSMEHSFQLVTAQITPQPEESHEHSGHGSDKKIGFTNALGLGGFGFGSRSTSGGGGGNKTNNPFARASVCSSSSHSRSSHSTTGDNNDCEADRGSSSRGHKISRYRRSKSTSVPRSQHQHQNPGMMMMTPSCSDHSYQPHPNGSSCSGGGEKLRSRSKSDWAVCKSCNCSSIGQIHQPNQIPLPPPHDCCDDDDGIYDSDINSDVEHDDQGVPFLPQEAEKASASSSSGGRKFSTSKSLHDFPADHPDWFLSQPSLCDGEPHNQGDTTNPKPLFEENHTIIRNNVMVRPLTSAQPGRYVARIQRGSESEMNLHMIGLKNGTTNINCPSSSLDQTKKKTSLRTSLKNIFSLKKRTTRTLQISGPILPSKTQPFPPRDRPPAVATLRYNNGRECYQSLPPEPVHLPPELNKNSGGVGGRDSRGSSSRVLSSTPENNCSPCLQQGGPSSLPPSQIQTVNQQPHLVSRYSRNPAGIGTSMSMSSSNKFPKLPKTPFMTKYQQFQGRRSPYTDV